MVIPLTPAFLLMMHDDGTWRTRYMARLNVAMLLFELSHFYMQRLAVACTNAE